MAKYNAKLFLEYLADDGEPLCEYWGICMHLEALGISEEINEVMNQWPEYSGWPEFPVPGPVGWGPYDAYDVLDKWVGPYGETRRRLCRWLAEHAKGIEAVEAPYPDSQAYDWYKPFEVK